MVVLPEFWLSNQAQDILHNLVFQLLVVVAQVLQQMQTSVVLFKVLVSLLLVVVIQICLQSELTLVKVL